MGVYEAPDPVGCLYVYYSFFQGESLGALSTYSNAHPQLMMSP